MLYRQHIFILLLIFTGKDHVSCNPVPNSVVMPRISRSHGSGSNLAMKSMEVPRLNYATSLSSTGKKFASPSLPRTANSLAAASMLRRLQQPRNTAIETKLTTSKQAPSIRLEESNPIKAEHQPTALERAGHVAGLLVLPLMAAPFIPMFLGNGEGSKTTGAETGTADTSTGDSKISSQSS